MEERATRKTITPELPYEVICDKILIRLPIRTVVRFKSVSKSWLSLFSSPKFVKDHLTHTATQNPKACDCLVVKKDQGIHIISRYKEELELRCDNSNDYQLVGAVRGLVCLRNKNKLLLWNPAIHQSKEFTLSSDCFIRHRNLLGLGFDPENNDYKVVISYHSAADSRSASIYSSNSNSWIDIFVPGYDVFPDNLDTPTTIVKDCPYWTFSTSLVKFDVTSNQFKVLPKFCTEENHEFVNMNDRLTLMEYEKNLSDCRVHVYSLDEGCGVWNKMYTVKLSSPSDSQCKNWYLSQGFKYGGEIVFQESGLLFCYDHGTDQKAHTVRRIIGTRSLSSNKCFSYTPSLVFLEGMKAILQVPHTLVLRFFGNNGYSISWK